MIVADSSGIIALIDAREALHSRMLELYEESADEWVLPAAILPEVDHLLLKRMGEAIQLAWVCDLAEARYSVEWGVPRDLVRTRELSERYRSLHMGLVDPLVMATAERLRARAIVTLDVRHFGAVQLKGDPKLFPRDL